jgi:hypothetical protein
MEQTLPNIRELAVKAAAESEAAKEKREAEEAATAKRRATEALKELMMENLGIDCEPTEPRFVIDGFRFAAVPSENHRRHWHRLYLMVLCPACNREAPTAAIDSPLDLANAIPIHDAIACGKEPCRWCVEDEAKDAKREAASEIPNPPAFPHCYANGEYITDHGMTLRDWFAGLAMQSCFAGEGATQIANRDKRYDETNWSEVVAKNAYEMADAMLKWRCEAWSEE